MSKKRIIKRILVVVASVLVCAGMLTLLIAAKSKQHTRNCSEVVISVNGGDKLYIDKSDILKILAGRLNGSIVHKSLDAFNLGLLEKALQKHPWVKNAQLFFDNQDALHVLVTEREPIMRVFTRNNNTFYLDSSGAQMPLLEKTNIRLPVVSGFPDYKRPAHKDSLLVQSLKTVVTYINANEFWKSQIAQIDVQESYDLEMIPVVGNHIIRFGNGENVADKFSRLMVFYKQVLTRTGFDKYRVIDVEYGDQVVGIKKEAVARVDSIRLQKNIENLMNQAHLQEADQQQPEVLAVTVNGYGPQAEQESTPLQQLAKTDSIHTNPILPKKEPVKKDIVKHTAKPGIKPAPVQHPKSNPKKTKPPVSLKPKAVMHKANDY